MGCQLFGDILEVVGIGITMAGDVAFLCFVVDLIPDDGVRLAGRHGAAYCESQTTLPGFDEKFEDLKTTPE